VDADTPTVAPTDKPKVTPTVDPGILADGALVAYLRERDEQVVRLQDELLARSEAAATWRARAEILAAQLAQAQSTIRALEAPKMPVEARRDAPQRESDAVTTSRPETESFKREKRPWWRFWAA
jgi:hypothetical protein